MRVEGLGDQGLGCGSLGVPGSGLEPISPEP